MSSSTTENRRHPEVVLAPEELRGELRRRSRRGFLVAGLAAAGGVGAYEWLTRTGSINGAPWPQRRVLEFDEKIAHQYLSNGHLMPTYRPDQVTYLKPNGTYGLDSDLNAAAWKLAVSSDESDAIHLNLSDVMNLPKRQLVTGFCCIEGWNAVAGWGGARFSDFTKKFFPPGRPLPKYVYLATPDEEYYVGLDMKSAMHPQTLLAYELNGKPLAPEHGAPLRLAIPVKYGIKNIKRIGSIVYTNDKPDDYWAEEGYDWFAGL